MKLEKLVYYCQAWSLVWDDRSLFAEDFEAWANGPVCPELFKKHQGYYFLEADFFGELNKDIFSAEQIETMDSIIRDFGDKEPQWLSDATHSEAPWLEQRKGLKDGAPSHRIISKESMKRFYSGL